MVDDWYKESFDVLAPLRFHLHVMIEEAKNANIYSSIAFKGTLVSPSKIEEAQSALDVAENHFYFKEKAVT